MNNNGLVKTIQELANRLSQAEIDRADFKSQAEQYLTERNALKKQVEALQTKLDKRNNNKKN